MKPTARQKISEMITPTHRFSPSSIAQHAVDQAGGGDKHAGGQVELAADHQHADTDGHDAYGRGLVEDGEERGRRAECRCDDQEEDEDDDGRDQGSDLGAAEQSSRPADLDAVGGLSRRRRCGLDRCTHGAAPMTCLRGGRANTRPTTLQASNYRVLFLTNGRTVAMLLLSTKDGPVRTGLPPPRILPFFLKR